MCILYNGRENSPQLRMIREEFMKEIQFTWILNNVWKRWSPHLWRIICRKPTHGDQQPANRKLHRLRREMILVEVLKMVAFKSDTEDI